MQNLPYSIIKTLCFFDVFDYPLTQNEIWKWLYRPERPYSLLEVRDCLHSNQALQKVLGQSEGFYSLAGREHICQKRKHNNNLAQSKFLLAEKTAKIYKYIPFVKMIAVCNKLAYSNANEDSDIDFFIIAKSGRIWLARFFTVLLSKLWGKRPREDAHANTLCLSFFIDERHLNIRHIMFSNQDIYTPYWLAQLMPIYDPAGLYEKFLAANAWRKEYLPNSYANKFVDEQYLTRPAKIFGKIFAFIVSPPLLRRWLDGIYRRVHSKIIEKNMQSIVNIDTRVIVNDNMLKFHAVDRREGYYKAWRDRVTNIMSNYESAKANLV